MKVEMETEKKWKCSIAIAITYSNTTLEMQSQLCALRE